MAACFRACTRVRASSMFWIWPSLPRYSVKSVSLSFSRPLLCPTAVMPVSSPDTSPESSMDIRSRSIRLSIRCSLTVSSRISWRSSCSLSGGTDAASCCSSGSRQSKKRVSNSPVVTAFLFPGGPPELFLLPGCAPLFLFERSPFLSERSLSHLCVDFHRRTVPSGRSSRCAISTSFTPFRYMAFASSILGSGALAMSITSYSLVFG